MAYIGSITRYNLSFTTPLSNETILYVLYATIIFIATVTIIRHFIKTNTLNLKETPLFTFINKVLTEKTLLTLTIIALLLEFINLILIGDIPLLSGTLKAQSTTVLWRISYLLFLPLINLLIAKFPKKRYYLLILIGLILFGINGYRTSLIAILMSTFITTYYIRKIEFKYVLIFLAIVMGLIAVVGFIAAISIEWQTWTLNPLQLILNRAAFTMKVYETALPLAGTTNGTILQMIFSSGSPRTFISEYVMNYTACLTSTLFGPATLDFGITGLTIQMILIGAILQLLHTLQRYKKEFTIAIYAFILAHTLIWIETGPTDSMVWILYIIAIIVLIINNKQFQIK